MHGCQYHRRGYLDNLDRSLVDSAPLKPKSRLVSIVGETGRVNEGTTEAGASTGRQLVELRFAAISRLRPGDAQRLPILPLPAGIRAIRKLLAGPVAERPVQGS